MIPASNLWGQLVPGVLLASLVTGQAPAAFPTPGAPIPRAPVAWHGLPVFAAGTGSDWGCGWNRACPVYWEYPCLTDDQDPTLHAAAYPTCFVTGRLQSAFFHWPSGVLTFPRGGGLGYGTHQTGFGEWPQYPWTPASPIDVQPIPEALPPAPALPAMP